jgi:hypothetical protein
MEKWDDVSQEKIGSFKNKFGHNERSSYLCTPLRKTGYEKREEFFEKFTGEMLKKLSGLRFETGSSAK